MDPRVGACEGKLRLLTTSRLQPDSLLAACYQAADLAPWEALLAEMDQHAYRASNRTLASKGVYARWFGLQGARRELLTRIEIASSHACLEASSDELEDVLMKRGVPAEIVSKVRESFVGAFMARLTNSLNSGGFVVSVQDLAADFLNAHARHATPRDYDFPEMQCPEEDLQVLKDSASSTSYSAACSN